jgi:hypothetical protein
LVNTLKAALCFQKPNYQKYCSADIFNIISTCTVCSPFSVQHRCSMCQTVTKNEARLKNGTRGWLKWHCNGNTAPTTFGPPPLFQASYGCKQHKMLHFSRDKKKKQQDYILVIFYVFNMLSFIYCYLI